MSEEHNNTSIVGSDVDSLHEFFYDIRGINQVYRKLAGLFTGSERNHGNHYHPHIPRTSWRNLGNFLSLTVLIAVTVTGFNIVIITLLSL